MSTREPYSVGRFRRALLQFAGARVVQALARVLLVLALVRVLPIADYGAYMLILGTSELLLQLASLGIVPVAQRYLPQLLTSLPRRRLYAFVAGLMFAQLAVLSLVGLAAAESWSWLAPRLGMDADVAAVASLGVWLLVLVPAFRLAIEVLEAMLAYGQTARAAHVTLRAVAVGALLLIAGDATLADVLLIEIGATAVCLLATWYGIYRCLRALHAPEAAGTLPWREMLRFAGHMALVGPLGAASTPGAMRLVLASGLGLAEAGLYAFLQSLERLVSQYLPATLLRNLVRPVLVARYAQRGNTDLLQAGTGLLLKSNLLAVVAGLVVIAVCGDQIVDLLSGGKFPQAGFTLLLLYVNMIATSQRGVQEMVMQITGHVRALWMTSLVTPLALFLVWSYADHGLNVAVAIVIAGSVVSNGLAAAVLQWRTGWFRVDWRGMAAIFLPGLGATSVGLLLANSVPAPYAGAAALASFVVLVRVGRPFRTPEIGAVERVVGPRAGLWLRGFAA
jgi:O-antigen/teichoic acid export membrane protein